jgi:hypothetical protein
MCLLAGFLASEEAFCFSCILASSTAAFVLQLAPSFLKEDLRRSESLSIPKNLLKKSENPHLSETVTRRVAVS